MASSYNSYKTKSRQEKALAEAFTKVHTTQESLNLLRDLLTPKELEEFGRRFEIARLLSTSELSYEDIAMKMKTSTTTVTRVALWLNNGCGGYKKALE
ncbi:MAG: YerC/YecD family TrpR-related protein [bacterium]|nr:YerC/YecD family TrpR-related protein [bacterium]